MAVIRINKTANYTVMSNAHFKEREMSLKAKGLLSLMLSLPDDWDYSIAGLVAICKESESAIKSTLNELKAFGYLVVSKKMPGETESGRIEYDYDIFEQSQKQGGKKQGVEIQGVEIQGVENHGQLSTKEQSTKEQSTNDINISSEFELLWELYPRKAGKTKALTAYQKARKKGTTFEQVKRGIEAYCRQIAVLKTSAEYIKHGSTWFRNECWNDEYWRSNVEIKETAEDDLAGIL